MALFLGAEARRREKASLGRCREEDVRSGSWRLKCVFPVIELSLAGYTITIQNVLAVGRCFNSVMLKSGDGTVIGSTINEFYEFMSSTYEGNMAWIGSPLLDFDGNFAGLSLCIDDSTAFLPTNKILECLGHFGTSRVGVITKEARKSQKHAIHNSLLEYLCEAARLDGYPSPTIISHDMDRMRVINSYEEEFEMNIWLTLTRDMASTMSECVVSLASFNDDCVVIFLLLA
ncbi:hypothetical protein PR202_gb04262 [Eleusine coracana subsp. coracana]|uniref:Uncharacterized protein n=1 Tax=Eleusine coracana subsp. coracana TaxID=191504 RepID=A0AAV5E3V3_ELECO|nr:hypothetical protein PR202_gb04262 [Eleusine coracana subsp. coracana]